MAGSDPAIHVFFLGKDVDTRVKPAHDEKTEIPHPEERQSRVSKDSPPSHPLR